MARLDRRALMGASLAMIAAPTAADALLPWPLAVQLWSVDAEMRRDVLGTLRALARLGYRSVEAAGWHGLAPIAFGKAVGDAGMGCTSAHIPFGRLAADTDAALGEARDAGCCWAVCPSPEPRAPLAARLDWNTALTRAMTRDDWLRHAETLDRVGARAATRGIGLAYHNHAAEFARYGDVSGLDLLLSGTSPANVRLELDIGWAAVAGQDPAKLIERLGRRVALLHLKDARRDGATRIPAPAGDGLIDWKAVLAAARRAGVAAAFVEVERPLAVPPLEALATVRDFLTRLR